VQTYHLHRLVRLSGDIAELPEKNEALAAIDDLEATLIARTAVCRSAETLVAIELRAKDGREVPLFHYGEAKRPTLREIRRPASGVCSAPPV
jgi:hypothetical protein